MEAVNEASLWRLRISSCGALLPVSKNPTDHHRHSRHLNLDFRFKNLFKNLSHLGGTRADVHKLPHSYGLSHTDSWNLMVGLVKLCLHCTVSIHMDSCVG
ncbi:unnamed protein product [Lactuca virosa]|uniref:Uncharacterized protein n=1 Tax=Lactuca virosa TaxID=75947 RepID=A0AAU9MAV6_9ASTR|nr:unnamed protein product [Lactuca virosa]